MSDLAQSVQRLDDEDPLVALAAVAALRRHVEQAERERVLAARRRALSWAEIGRALGTSKQSVHRKHGGPDDPGPRLVQDPDWPPKVVRVDRDRRGQ